MNPSQPPEPVEIAKALADSGIDCSRYSIYYPECRPDIDEFTDCAGLMVEGRAEKGIQLEAIGRVGVHHSFCEDPDGLIPYLSIADIDPVIRERSVDLHLDALSQAMTYGASALTLHPPIWRDSGKTVGKWDHFIESMKSICTIARTLGILIHLENPFLLWRSDMAANPDLASAAARGEVDPADLDRAFFCLDPDDWARVVSEVGAFNLSLCLCVSHAVTTSALAGPEPLNRIRFLHRFLEHSHLVTHVHWADNYLEGPESVLDNHLPLGRGDVPEEFYRGIASIDAGACLELWCQDVGAIGFADTIRRIEGHRNGSRRMDNE